MLDEPATLGTMGDKGPYILVVDDELAQRTILAKQLRAAGFSVLTAENGAKALEIICNEAISLVLLDVMMPGMNGLEVLYLIRSAHDRVEMPVIMVTAMDQSDQIVGAFELGANDYITKPVDFNVALARVKLHIATSKPKAADPNSIGGGRYRIERLIGIGGFSQTYLARDQHRPTHPEVVVKRLQREVSGNVDDWRLAEMARRSFSQEAAILETLGLHPQIPQLFAHFEEDGQFYIVQEYVSGYSLRQRLSAGFVWSIPQVLDFLEQMLSILGFVHSQNLIHRDIKPSNIIATDRDQKTLYYLIDFGAIKIVDPKQENPTHFIGTPGYAPFEQYSGYPRFNSDIYALGRVVIEMLIGSLPEVDLRTQHLIPLSRQEPELAYILERMIQPDADQRYVDVAEVKASLVRYNAHHV